MDATKMQDLLSAVLQSPSDRQNLYLNVDRVSTIYHLNGGLDQIQLTEGFDASVQGEVSVLIAKIGSSGVSKEGSIVYYNVLPVLMARTLEELKKRQGLLVDPAKDERYKNKGVIYTHSNVTCLARADLPVFGQIDNLSKAAADIIEEERKKQVDRYQSIKQELIPLVWVSTQGRRILASIISAKYVDENAFGSNPQLRIGILGMFESEQEGVVFISPLWLWYEM